MRFFETRRKYAPLPTGSVDEELQQKTNNVAGDQRKQTHFISTVSFVIALACTAFNIAFIVTQHTSSPSSPKIVDVRSLPRPNQFIGLEKVDYTAHPLGDIRITTFPSTLALVDRSRPRFVYPDDPRRQFTYFGTISPEDRNFLATNEISTIAQFRVRDWGMEKCRLQISLPHEAEFNSTGNESERQRNWLLAGDTNDLEAWFLDTSSWVDPGSLNFSNKPRRKSRLFSFRVRGGRTVSSHEFRCVTDSIQSIELFCVSPRCRVDVWQDQMLPAIGLSIEQRASAG